MIYIFISLGVHFYFITFFLECMHACDLFSILSNVCLILLKKNIITACWFSLDAIFLANIRLPMIDSLVILFNLNRYLYLVPFFSGELSSVVYALLLLSW